MFIGVDWAGDPGMKFSAAGSGGSRPRCVMAVAACHDEPGLQLALATLRQERSLRKDFEFHYSEIDDSSHLREEFMAAVAGLFTATVAIYDKTQMQPSWAWGRDTDLLMQLIVHCVLGLAPTTLARSKMILDGEREAKTLGRKLRPIISKALAERDISERLSKIVPGNSRDYDVLQLADMIGGAVHDAARRASKDTHFLGDARGNVTILRITPEMEKPTK